MNTSEVLYGAADHIERFGHHKGSGFADRGAALTSPACLIGAICAQGSPVEGLAVDAVGGYLGQSIVQWNDAPERTPSEVIEVLRAAAVIEAAKENADTREQVSA